jgi:sphingomyelin phosphodiesterase
MRFSSFVNALGAVAVLPVVATALSVSDVMRKSVDAYARAQKRSLVSEILTDIEDLAECTACEVCGRLERKTR